MPVTLNQGQDEAAEAFFMFLFNDDKEFIISGPGGVGKTTLMSNMIDEIMPRYFETCKLMGISPKYDEVIMSATTNKASEVLAIGTLRPTKTIHSFLNLKVKDDFKTGRSLLTKTNNWMVHEKKIIFIDECSMVDSDLYEMLHEGTQDCKIIYVGDHCQLAPVMETLSPIYRKELPFNELTEPMRNAEQPALMNLCNQLRHTVETGEFYPIQIVPGVIDLLDDIQMEQQLKADFTNQTHDARILSYTNRRVLQFNDEIRYIRQLPDAYGQGEFLVNNNAIQLRTRMLSVEEEITIGKQADQTELEAIDKDANLEVRKTDLVSRIGETFTDVLIPEDRDHFQALVKFYQGRKNWERYFYLKNKFPDLRQRDAATVYKAQGSTYDTVYIDLGDISTCHQANQVARMLYVAVSRARTRIFLYGNLADKYGGLIH